MAQGSEKLGCFLSVCAVLVLFPPGLAEDFLTNYTQVNIGSLELTANPRIKQIVEVCEENEKLPKLVLLQVVCGLTSSSTCRLFALLSDIMSKENSKVCAQAMADSNYGTAVYFLQ